MASNLGWVFDGFEAYALILTVGVALRQLLDASQHERNSDLCRHRMRKALLANPDIGVTQIAHRLGVSPATLYRYIPAARTANTPSI